ncbi:MAG: hypothetical protein OXE76_15220 [Alphaproteobacteria bacterium]|nr:hypothetical protein [Alphaproteobacteria bacterium]
MARLGMGLRAEAIEHTVSLFAVGCERKMNGTPFDRAASFNADAGG